MLVGYLEKKMKKYKELNRKLHTYELKKHFDIRSFAMHCA